MLPSPIMLTDNPTPQFGTAEYASADSGRCKSCNQTLGSQHYRVNGAVTCVYCAEQVKLRLPVDSHSSFVRALIFGIGGAILKISARTNEERSEEHTSELQSQSNLVCRLLLEKTKTHNFLTTH